MDYDKKRLQLEKQMESARRNLLDCVRFKDIKGANKFFGIINYINNSYEDLTGTPMVSESLIDYWMWLIRYMEDNDGEI